MTPGPRPFGPYLLERELGRGNQGAVYLARRDGGAPMALKVLLDEVDDEEARARFARETSIARRLDHPGIVRALDAGRVAGRAFYAMELCPGPTLERRLGELPGGLPPDEAGRLVAEVARAAHAAHELGIVHRDLKPANIILSEPDGWPKITDFGLAHDALKLRALTRTGDRLGTPMTMAPEQLRGEREVDRRADVHALGAILYRCLTGRHPRQAASVPELLQQVELGPPPPPPSRWNPAVWPALDAVTLAALARERGQRPQTAEALAEAIEAALDAAAPPPRSGRPLLLVAGLALLTAGTAVAVGLRLSAGEPMSATTTEPAPATEPAPGTEPAPATEPSAAGPATELPAAEPARDEPRVVVDGPAPDEALATVVAGIVENFQPDEALRRREVRSRGLALAPLLLHDHPRDPRVQALAGTMELLASSQGDGLALRRRYARARQASPPPDDDLLAAGGRLCLELGFQRAAVDLAARALDPDGGARSPWAAQTLMLLCVVTEPPQRDLERAERAGRASLAALAGRPGPELPPRHDTLLQLMNLRMAARDRAGAEALLDEAFALRGEVLRPLVDDTRPRIRSGELDGFDPALMVGISFGTGDHLAPLHGRWTARRREPRTATMLDREGRALEAQGRHAEAALLHLGAGVAWRGAGDAARARQSVERAAAVPVDRARDGDVLGLVQLEHARSLLGAGDAEAAEGAALRATRPWPSPDDDLRTPGERADAWTVVGRARLRRGDLAGAREAAAKAAHELAVRGPWDRRELDELRADLR